MARNSRGDDVEYQAHRAPVHISAVIDSLGPLFDQTPESRQREVPKDLTRRMDHETSKAAAWSLTPHLTQLQHRVMDAFRFNGAMTDEQLEQLPCFASCSPSTIRKRRSELVERGSLMCVGQAKNAKSTATMKVWAPVPPPHGGRL